MLHRCFGRPVTSAFDPGGGQPLPHRHQHPGQELVAQRGPAGHHLLDLGVALGVEGGEGQVLELPLDLLDAEPVGQRGVDVEGLLGGAALLPLGHHRQGPHVVQAVGQLDDQHPPVVGHGHQHLAHGGRLLGLLGVELEPVELGHPVDDEGHRGPKSRSMTSVVTPVSSTASWRRAAATVWASRPRSATMPATAMGWVT